MAKPPKRTAKFRPGKVSGAHHLAFEWSGSRPVEGEGRFTTLQFGSVRAEAVAPHPDVKGANIAAGQEALKRAKTAFVTTGVSLRHRKSVPTYFADAHDPNILIRRLDGREERGRFVDGAFVAGQ